MGFDYNYILQAWMSELNQQNIYLVYVPEHTKVVLFKSYRAIHTYMKGQLVPDDIKREVYATHTDYDYSMYKIGNQGFKTTYLKVYPKVRNHPKYGVYVGWVVHL